MWGYIYLKPYSLMDLYVVLSRTKTSNSIKILVRPTLVDKSDYDCTKNIIYHELLTSINSY